MLTRPAANRNRLVPDRRRSHLHRATALAASAALITAACGNSTTNTPVAPSLSSPSPSATRSSPSPVPSLSSSSPSPSRTPQTPTATTTGNDAEQSPDDVQGLDVSGHQVSVDWARWYAKGARFVYVKATEGTSYRNPRYPTQRKAARAAGYMQGSYHYARPASSSGAAQARFFVSAGGSWKADGNTLPGALDLEAGEKAECHGLTPKQMSAWVRDFTTTYRKLTGRNAVIYVKADLWNTCTDGDASFGTTNPLWLYDHDATMGPLPAGWSRATLWQYGVVNGLDRNRFNGSAAKLTAWAAGQ